MHFSSVSLFLTGVACLASLVSGRAAPTAALVSRAGDGLEGDELWYPSKEKPHIVKLKDLELVRDLSSKGRKKGGIMKTGGGGDGLLFVKQLGFSSGYTLDKLKQEVIGFRELGPLVGVAVPQFRGFVKGGDGHDDDEVVGFMTNALRDARPAERSDKEELKKCASLLKMLHRHGVCHGDTFIHNCLLDGNGRAWLVDLEDARRVSGPAAAACFLDDKLHLMLGRDGDVWDEAGTDWLRR